jgi:hypothetical protein
MLLKIPLNMRSKTQGLDSFPPSEVKMTFDSRGNEIVAVSNEVQPLLLSNFNRHRLGPALEGWGAF